MVCLGFSKLFSQDVRFSQFYTDRLALNPALAGSLINSNLSILYRTTTPDFGTNFSTYSCSYDKYCEKISGGIGLRLFNDSQGQGFLKTFSSDIIYSYHLKVNKRKKINFALQFTYSQQKINTENLIFSNMIDPFSNTINQNSNEIFEHNNKNNISFSGGFAYSDKKFFGGISLKHISNIFFYENEKIFTPKYTVYFGKKILLNNFDHTNNWNIIPNIIFISESQFYDFSYGLFLTNKKLSTGLCLTHDIKFQKLTPVFLIEVSVSGIKISYSYDIQINKYLSLPVSGHEFGITYIFGNNKKIKTQNTIYCPNF